VLRLIARRLGSAVLLTAVVTLTTFVLIFSNGPGIARAILGKEATQETVHAKVVQLGLDQPVLVQYAHWLGDLFTGSLGQSYFTQEPVTSMLATRVPVTASLAAIILLLTTVISVLVGVAAAVYGGWIDRLLQFLSVLGSAVPGFIVAILLVLGFAVSLRLLPATGYVSPSVSVGGWLVALVLPVLSVLVGSVGGSAQQFRGAVADVLGQDFVRTLRARGVSERRIVFGHVLRSAAGPGLTILGLQTIGLLGGVVLIERIFALPGVGDLTVSTAQQGDIPAVMGCVLFTIVVVVVVNLLADLVAAWINPKARAAA
jgi:peptide/nickel transport system permease protein